MDVKRLRQRRARIIKDKAREDRKKDEVRQILNTTQSQTTQAIRIVIAVVTAVIVTVAAILEFQQPGFFRKIVLGKRGSIPTFYFATQYPPNVVVERDLPRFFRTYSIASFENEFAQDAVRKVQRSRTQLKRRAGIIQTILRAWDISNVQMLLHRGVCGSDFEEAYHDGSQLRKNDLLMWCLLGSRIAEGFFKESVEFIDTALFMLRKRGMVVQKSITPSSDSTTNPTTMLSTSYYLHPRTNTTNVEWIPAKVLAWMISNPEETLGTPIEAQEMLERYLYDQVIQGGNEDDFLVLEEICQDDRPNRAIAMDCQQSIGTSQENCCYFVVPEKYGGRIIPDDAEDED